MTDDERLKSEVKERLKTLSSPWSDERAIMVFILGAAVASFPRNMPVPYAVVGWSEERAVARVHFLVWLPPIILVHLAATMSVMLTGILPLTIRTEVSCRRL